MKDSIKANLLLIAALIIDLVASYYTTELILYIARESGTVILWQNYIGMFVFPLIIYSIILLLVWARLCNIWGWDKKFRSPYK